MYDRIMIILIFIIIGLAIQTFTENINNKKKSIVNDISIQQYKVY